MPCLSPALPTPPAPLPAPLVLRALAAGALLALLAACGGGSEGGSPVTRLPQEVTIQGGPLADAWHDVAVDAEGRIWLAGHVDGRRDLDRLDPGGNARAVVRRLSPTGALEWDSGALFDTAGSDTADALLLSPQGTVFVAGRTTGRMADDVAPGGQTDAWIAWADGRAGTPAWRRFQTGDERPQHPRRLALDAAGDLLLAGQDDDWIPSNHVAAWSDPRVMKLRRQPAPGGERLQPQWTHAFNTDHPDLLDGLATPPAGSPEAGVAYVSGVVNGGGTPLAGAYVRKLDAQGLAVWTARYTNTGLDNVAAVKMQPDGTLLIAGSVFGSFQGRPAGGQSDVFVARIHPADGRVLQAWQYGSDEAEWLTDMAVDAQGGIVLLGETGGRMVPGQPSAGGQDLFMLRLAPDGSITGRRQWGTAGNDEARRLALDAAGTALAVGHTGGLTPDAVLWRWQR